jgi:hypothetical protein
MQAPVGAATVVPCNNPKNQNSGKRHQARQLADNASKQNIVSAIKHDITPALAYESLFKNSPQAALDEKPLVNPPGDQSSHVKPTSVSRYIGDYPQIPTPVIGTTQANRNAQINHVAQKSL